MNMFKTIMALNEMYKKETVNRQEVRGKRHQAGGVRLQGELGNGQRATGNGRQASGNRQPATARQINKPQSLCCVRAKVKANKRSEPFSHTDSQAAK